METIKIFVALITVLLYIILYLLIQYSREQKGDGLKAEEVLPSIV